MKPGELEIIVEQDGDGFELRLVGELDLASADELEQRITMLCLEGASQIGLDLERLDFVDSAGLRAMLAARQTCEQSGCSLALRNCSERVRRVLELTGMDAVLRVNDGESQTDEDAPQQPAPHG
jgi:anti-sigma B factor antagonist